MSTRSSRPVLLDGRLVPAASARVSPLGEGFLFGRGLFETIKVASARPLFLADHAARLRRSARVLGLRPPLPLAGLGARCRRLLRAQRLEDGILKVVVFENAGRVSELILARPGGYPAQTYRRGFHLAIKDRPAPGGPITRHKTLAYLGNLAARREAVSAGLDEVLFAGPDGLLTEGSGTNVFAVTRGRALTPPLGPGILPGTARARVIRLLGPGRVRERALSVAELLKADEVFVTNAILGVMPVSRIGGRRLDLARTPFTRSLREAYRAAEAASQRRTRPAMKSTAGA
jgi:branched-subunit amino acid aminotransferase/4-amino-4-deoxychorismate lyase